MNHKPLINKDIIFDMRDRLRQFREETLKIKITALARKLHISHVAYGNYERGSSEPSLKTYQALAEMGCDIGWLITGKVNGDKTILQNSSIDIIEFHRMEGAVRILKEERDDYRARIEHQLNECAEKIGQLFAERKKNNNVSDTNLDKKRNRGDEASKN